jgi:pyruvate kinase
VATQVLESMTTEARPTRAEVNDAANAVEDGVDAIMLAGETAVGAHAVRAVKTLNAIIGDAETAPLHGVTDVARSAAHDDHARALCEAAVTLVERSAARAIVAVTRGGTTARWLSALRPHAPIIAATEHEVTGRRLTLYWGAVPLCMPIGENLDEASTRISTQLVQRGLVSAGATCVFVSISADLSRRDANYLKIHRL